ncbi:carboxypeptidase-like regulatory domain-containing protein [Hyalangium sp.]|uniref:carboxypeptidase-like regulatory domain-containing protein n=1 Tax=Hyalangium sp. TaxID=2028555 RepID=UPI002D29673B|nr:carboxypeptidase-like regulatory domain-containing protein [Hyalangium sp.]HYI02300.1 carboxypeptidase-like regulatory domain-containing protein [Hyalangium sp.]
MRTRKIPAALVTAITLLWASAAAATEPRLATLIEEIGPWTQGVPKQEQQKAEALFHAGNEQFEESAHAAAARKYREALKSWDHPAIHYNLALALTALDRPLEIRKHLASAIRYDAAPLDPVKFEYAKTTLALIEKQLARVRIVCDEPGASVSMDGEFLFIGPGKYEDFVRPGPHTLIATKEGYLTTTLRPALSPGQQSELPVTMKIDQIEYQRKWSAWKPWAVVSTGVALAVGGGLFYRKAQENYRTFDAEILKCGGCLPPPWTSRFRSQGERQHKLAFGTWAVGGAALVTGTALVLLNRPEPYRSQAESSEQTVVIAPLLGSGARGVVMSFPF